MIRSINKLLENFQGNVRNPKYEMMRADAYHQLCEITDDENLRSRRVDEAWLYYE